MKTLVYRPLPGERAIREGKLCLSGECQLFGIWICLWTWRRFGWERCWLLLPFCGGIVGEVGVASVEAAAVKRAALKWVAWMRVI